MRIQAEAEGKWWAAEVVAVKSGKQATASSVFQRYHAPSRKTESRIFPPALCSPGASKPWPQPGASKPWPQLGAGRAKSNKNLRFCLENFGKSSGVCDIFESTATASDHRPLLWECELLDVERRREFPAYWSGLDDDNATDFISHRWIGK